MFTSTLLRSLCVRRRIDPVLESQPEDGTAKKNPSFRLGKMKPLHRSRSMSKSETRHFPKATTLRLPTSIYRSGERTVVAPAWLPVRKQAGGRTPAKPPPVLTVTLLQGRSRSRRGGSETSTLSKAIRRRNYISDGRGTDSQRTSFFLLPEVRPMASGRPCRVPRAALSRCVSDVARSTRPHHPRGLVGPHSTNPQNPGGREVFQRPP